MEEDPFALLEAMTIAGFATGCEQGYLYIRGEYPLAARRLTHAIEQARARGLLGADVMAQGFRFEIELRRGAGAYICGEETALLNSIEGYRGEPRNKPPFPCRWGCSVNRPWSIMWRPWSTCWRSSVTGNDLCLHRYSRFDGHQALLRVWLHRAPRCLRGPFRHDLAAVAGPGRWLATGTRASGHPVGWSGWHISPLRSSTRR